MEFKRSTNEGSRLCHLDGKQCKIGQNAISAYIAHSARRSDPTPIPSPQATSSSIPSRPLHPPLHSPVYSPSPFAHRPHYPCPGLTINWDVGDFWTNYPYHLHALSSDHRLPYYFESMLPPRIRADKCCGAVSVYGLSCESCDGLRLGINVLRERAQRDFDRVYRTEELTWTQLRAKLDAREVQLNNLKLETQNLTGLLHTAREKVDEFTALFKFLHHHPVPALYRILAHAGADGWSTTKTLKKCKLAVEGRYHPTNFFQWEIDLGMIVYELGGLSAVYAFSKSPYALPSRNTLQKHRREKTLRPCVYGVHLGDVLSNISTYFGDTPESPSRLDFSAPRRYLHTASFDEIAKSAIVDYISELDAMGGLCLEHLFELPSVQIGETIETIETAARLVREGKVHVADLISVGAISQLSRTGYGAKPVFVGSSCKMGDANDVLRVVQAVIEAWERSPDGEAKHGPITSVASDGDSKRRIAFFVLCLTNEVVEGNPIHDFVKNLFGLNLFTGKNNLTMDFDFKHEIKRICTTIRSPQGLLIKGVCINRDMLLHWLERIPGYDWSEVSIHALLNPPDAQDVPRAVKLLLVIVDIRNIDKSSLDATEEAEYEALGLFGALLDALLQPFINTTLSLSQQTVYLVKFSFLLCSIYLKHTTSFIPNQLYGDLQAMVKNAIFLIAKTRAFDPELEVFFCLLGDDVLETLFGRIRMVGGHHPNCGLAEFCTRGRSAMNLDSIFGRNPHLERKPDRLNMFRMQHVDHLRPAQYKSELRANSCDLDECWAAGVAAAEEVMRVFGAPLTMRENGREILLTFRQLFSRKNTDLLRPMGGKYPSVSGAVDRSLGDMAATEKSSADIDINAATSSYANPFSGLSTAEILSREAQTLVMPIHLCSAFARIDDMSERRVHKSSALRILFDMYVDLQEAHDRLYRVRGFSSSGKLAWSLDGTEGGVIVSAQTHFQLGQLFATLVSHNGVDIALAIAKVTMIKDGRSGKARSISAVPCGELTLPESPYIVSGQVLSLVPTPAAGPTFVWVWDQKFVSLSLAKKQTKSDNVSRVANLQISVSTRLIVPFSDQGHEIETCDLPVTVPMAAKREKTWYFWDTDLRNTWATLWTRVNEDKSLHNKFPRFTRVVEGAFPYVIPLINGQPNLPSFYTPAADTSVANTFLQSTACDVCGKNVKDQRRQNHMGQHILLHLLRVPDSRALPGKEITARYPCGFCGGDATKCGLSIDSGNAQSDCPYHYAFRVSSARNVSDTTPCTNAPIKCPLYTCNETHWKYNFLRHLQDRHPGWRDTLSSDSTLLSTLPVTAAEQLALQIPSAVDWFTSQLPASNVNINLSPSRRRHTPSPPTTPSKSHSHIVVTPKRRRIGAGKENIQVAYAVSPGSPHKRRRIS
ncbi:hypothetical protein C8F01DRAFT_1231949 [Mycena amicta]|nr:hypothetical protein C8F01DRAFT_1231949 [Mycena amicta]